VSNGRPEDIPAFVANARHFRSCAREARGIHLLTVIAMVGPGRGAVAAMHEGVP